MKKTTKKASGKKSSTSSVKDLNPKTTVKGGVIRDEGGIGGLM